MAKTLSRLSRGAAKREAYERLFPLVGDSALGEADLIVKMAVDDQASLLLTANELLTNAQESRFQTLLTKRCARKPLSRIQGVRHFWNYEFHINEHVLDPRPDSEVLVEQALLHLPDNDQSKILDLGTGSGCLILSVLGERTGCHGLGVDFSEDALKVARRNADKMGLSGRVEFQQGDWASEIGQRFDLVLCNPPYIDKADESWMEPEVLNHDPHSALFAANKGLADYETIFDQLHKLLKPDAIGLFEHGFQQRDVLKDLAIRSGLKVQGEFDDLSGNPRCLMLALK